MNKVLRIALALLGLLVLAGAGTYGWATMRSSSLLSRTIDTHAIDFRTPIALTAAEVAALAPGEDPDEAALARAIERGHHLVMARYGCGDCHGADFGGGTMVDSPALGTLLGPNLTLGSGSVTLDYDASDWDRAVRHGVRSDGTPSLMPSTDYIRMSDEELSDIVAFIRSLPPVDAEVVPVRLGPIGKVLVATGQLPFAADLLGSHDQVHSAMPPAATVSVEFGEHLSGVCTGCHGANLAGGPIVGGDPSWPPARNLTPHVDGLAGWTLQDFRRALFESVRPDGSGVLAPMSDLAVSFGNMTDVEVEALWVYLRSVTPVATAQ